MKVHYFQAIGFNLRPYVEVEWFIEGDFDRYCETLRLPHTWGGEPEILMLTHVLGMAVCRLNTSGSDPAC